MRAILMSVAVAVGLTASRAAAAGLVVDGVPLACGQSDFVWEAIHAAEGEATPIHSGALRARQGETGRRLVVFDDRSWYLVLEFLSLESADDDVSCVVAKGDRDSLEEAVRLRVSTLPAARIGPPLTRALPALDAGYPF